MAGEAGGQVAQAESVLALAKARFPENTTFGFTGIVFDRELGRTDGARARFDSARKTGDKRAPANAINSLVPLDYALGRVAEARSLGLQAAAMDPAAGRVSPVAFRIADDVGQRALDGRPTDAAVSGRLDKAKAILARYESEVRDTAVRRLWHSDADSEIADWR